MAGNIKGIIVEIGGDTSGLQKALSKVNSQTSSLSKELRGINSLLKLDPKNAELLSQKQEVLNKSIETTQEKLNQLNKIKEEADNKMAQGTQVSEENYRALQREIINTESKLKKLNLENSKWTTAGKNIEEFGNKLKETGNKIDSVGNKLSTKLTLPITALGTAAIATGNDFEAQMSRVQAIAGATAEELEKLTDQAIELGAKTSFSASEVAEGMENLASAGFTTNEIMKAMPGLLDLAASSGAELATASEIAASTIRGFGLEAKTSGHVADVFAEAAARTNAQTEDMGEAMKYVAPVAKTVGLTLEETAAAIGIMSDAGVKGSQAGTSLRGGLTRIVKPTKQVAEAMEELGVEFYDNDGKMKSLTEIVEELQKSTEGLTDETKNQALAQIFGTNALSGMLALVNRGPKELKKMTKSFEKCDGAAAEMAETMLDNASGSIESLMGSIESAGIAIQKTLSPTIKDLAGKIQGLVDKFTNLSEEEQLNIIKTAGLVAGIGPLIKVLGGVTTTAGKVTGGIGTLSQAIGVLKSGTDSGNTAVDNLAGKLSALTSPAGLATLAVAGVSAAVIYLATKQTEAQKEAEEFAKQMADSKKALDDYNASIDATTKSNLAQIESTALLKDELKTLVDENGKVKKGYEKRVDFILNQLNTALGTEYKLNGNIIASYKNLQKEIDNLIEKKKAEIILKGQEEKYTSAIKEQEKAIEDLKNANENLGDTYENVKAKYLAMTVGPNKQYGIEADKEKKRLKGLLDAYEDAESRVKTYTENVKTYEKNYEEFMKGNYTSISNTVKSTTEDWCDKSLEEINNSIKEQKKSLETYKKIYKDTGNQVAKQKQEQAEKDLKNLAEELVKRTKTIGTLGQQEIEAWKNLATSSYDIYSEKISKMSPEMKKKIEDATGVIASETPKMKEMAKTLGTTVIQEFDKSADAKKKALEIMTSYMNGLSDEEKRKLLKEIGIKNADIVLKELDKEKLSEENGKNILEGLKKGLSNNSLTKKIKQIASGLAQAVNKAFTGKKGWDEHSPSKKMEKYAKNYVKPISTVMQSEERNIVNIARSLANKVNTAFSNSGGISSLQSLNNKKREIDTQKMNNTKTVFTTPQINFNVQDLDEEKLQQCFNYINKKFGSAY